MQLDPNFDNIFGHIMLHPSQKVFHATSAEHALLQMAFECFTKDSGLYRGAFMDPIEDEEQPGRYEVTQGSTTVGCFYKNFWGTS